VNAQLPDEEPIVITGIGMNASLGLDREAVWRGIRLGRSRVRRISGLDFFQDEDLLGATVDLDPYPPGKLKAIALLERAAAEAWQDAHLHVAPADPDRCGSAFSAHLGDLRYLEPLSGKRSDVDWWDQFLPNSGGCGIANHYGLRGPRLCHSTACASGAVELLAGMRAIRDGSADLMLVGSGEAITPLFAAGFRKMRVLANHPDPRQACRPFDKCRNGFVMGEGAAVLIIERLSHALDRGARIYAEIVSGKMVSEGHHITDLDAQSDGLRYVIDAALRQAKLAPDEIEYINVHGTGTQQNDLAESVAIRRAFGRAADRIPVSAIKSMLGHLVNASGSVEVAITALALRDGFVPPTINLTNPDPGCLLEHVALVGQTKEMQHAIKLSVAFGGHLVALVLRRWNDAKTGFLYPCRSWLTAA